MYVATVSRWYFDEVKGNNAYVTHIKCDSTEQAALFDARLLFEATTTTEYSCITWHWNDYSWKDSIVCVNCEAA